MCSKSGSICHVKTCHGPVCLLSALAVLGSLQGLHEPAVRVQNGDSGRAPKPVGLTHILKSFKILKHLFRV